MYLFSSSGYFKIFLIVICFEALIWCVFVQFFYLFVFICLRFIRDPCICTLMSFVVFISLITDSSLFPLLSSGIQISRMLVLYTVYLLLLSLPVPLSPSHPNPSVCVSNLFSSSSILLIFMDLVSKVQILSFAVSYVVLNLSITYLLNPSFLFLYSSVSDFYLFF